VESYNPQRADVDYAWPSGKLTVEWKFETSTTNWFPTGGGPITSIYDLRDTTCYCEIYRDEPWFFEVRFGEGLGIAAHDTVLDLDKYMDQMQDDVPIPILNTNAVLFDQFYTQLQTISLMMNLDDRPIISLGNFQAFGVNNIIQTPVPQQGDFWDK
jgi:hypothetical protein